MTTFLATILGWYFVILSLFVLLKRNAFLSISTDIFKSRASTFIMSLITLIAGLLMVVSHNVWTHGWPLMVTIISWLILVSGVLRIFCLDSFSKKAKTFFSDHGKLTTLAVILFIVGLSLLYHVCEGHKYMHLSF